MIDHNCYIVWSFPSIFSWNIFSLTSYGTCILYYEEEKTYFYCVINTFCVLFYSFSYSDYSYLNSYGAGCSTSYTGYNTATYNDYTVLGVAIAIEPLLLTNM